MLNLFFILFSMASLLMNAAFAQPGPDALWTRTYGGASDDAAYSVQETRDEGYIVAGFTMPLGADDKDFYLVKTDANGKQVWGQRYGGNDPDECYSVRQTSDGGYILGGYTYSFGAGNKDFWLVKTDANGRQLWSKTFGGGGEDECRSVQQTSEGGYILAGTTESFGAGWHDAWIVKTDPNGKELWSRTFGGEGEDRCYSIDQTSDGGYILGGDTSPHESGGSDFWLVKTDAKGNRLWSRTLGGENDEFFHSLQQTSDGGYILAGFAFSWSWSGGENGILLMKTAAKGDSLWSRTFGGKRAGSYPSVRQTSDGGYILGGYTWSSGVGTPDHSNMYLVKTDGNGKQLWSKTYGGKWPDECYSVQQTSDGGYILAGCTYSFGSGRGDIWLVKTKPQTESPSVPKK